MHDVLLCDGDDHRRIRRDLPALCSELERRLPGTQLHDRSLQRLRGCSQPDELPAWTGELLGSRLQNVLRGVNSARLYLKRANERAERRLLEVETLAALRTLRTRERFPAADFRLAWRRLLKCHPHDSICGCSCDEVHRDMLVRYELLERTVHHSSSSGPSTDSLRTPARHRRRRRTSFRTAGADSSSLTGWSRRPSSSPASAPAPSS